MSHKSSTFVLIILIAAVLVGSFAPLEAAAQPAIDPGAFAEAQGNANRRESHCSITSSDTYSRCLSDVFYYLFVPTTAPFTFIAGQVFNFSVAFSMDGTILKNSTITSGWKTVRDVANIAFIFILIYIAIATILSLEGFHTYKLLARLVVVALLINFSLFASRVVIDASNILGLQFYNAITAGQQEQPRTIVGIAVEVPSDLSVVVLGALGTHDLLSNDSFRRAAAALTGGGGFGTNVAILITVYIALGIINIVTAFVLFAAAFLFVGRIVGLWFLMIFAPIGFIGFILPETQKWAKQWWHMLFAQSFFAPLFLFLFTIFALFLSGSGTGGTFLTNILGDATKTLTAAGAKNYGEFWGAFGLIVINFVIVIAFLIGILTISKKVASQGGGMLVNWADKGRRFATGFAGRNTFGRLAYLMASPETGVGKRLQRLSRTSPMLGRTLYGGLRATAGFGFGQKESKGFAGGVKAQREFTKEHVGFALTGLEGEERKREERRMLRKIAQPFGGITAVSSVPGQQLAAAGAALATSTGAKEVAAERLRVLGRQEGEMKTDLKGAADRFNKTIDTLAAELGRLLHSDDGVKFDATKMRTMNRDDLMAMAKNIGDRIDRHENRYAPQLEGRRIEADRTGNWGRMTELLAVEKANSKTTAAMKELRGEIKKLIATEERKE